MTQITKLDDNKIIIFLQKMLQRILENSEKYEEEKDYYLKLTQHIISEVQYIKRFAFVESFSVRSESDKLEKVIACFKSRGWKDMDISVIQYVMDRNWCVQ